MAAQYSGDVAAVCCHAGHIATAYGDGYGAVPTWLVHGRKDDTILYNGFSVPLPTGVGTVNVGYWSIEETTDYITTKNGCQESFEKPVKDENKMQIGTTRVGYGCDGNTNVEVVTLDESGHFPYQLDESEALGFFRTLEGEILTRIDTTALAWDFCSAQSKKSTDDDCKDVSGSFEVKKIGVKDCRWAGKKKKRCKKKLNYKINGRKKVKNICPVTCGKCDKNRQSSSSSKSISAD